MTRNVRTPYLSFDTLALACLADGVRPRIMVPVWYPVHDVEIIVRERTQERITGIDLAVLGIIGEGISDVRDIIEILGIQERFSQQILHALIGDGQIVETKSGHLELSALGRYSLQEGAFIVETPRAFLICGMSGQILHRSVHAFLRHSPTKTPMRGHEWSLEPAYKVSNALLGLDIGAIRSQEGRKGLADLGIPDEAIGFGEVKSSSGCFIRVQLAVGTRRNGRIGGQIRISNELAMPISLVEKDMKTELAVATAETDALVAAIRETLAQTGIIAGMIRVAGDGVLVGQVDSAAQATQHVLDGRSWLFRLGTPQQPALPLWQLWGQSRGQECLKGNCLYLETEAPALASQAEALRCAWSALDKWYALPRPQRPESLPQTIAEALVGKDVTITDLVTLARRTGDRILADRMEEC